MGPSHPGLSRDLRRFLLYGEPEKRGAKVLEVCKQVRPANQPQGIPALVDRGFRHERVRNSVRRSKQVDVNRSVEVSLQGGTQRHR